MSERSERIQSNTVGSKLHSAGERSEAGAVSERSERANGYSRLKLHSAGERSEAGE
jgi:hypothetical protein